MNFYLAYGAGVGSEALRLWLINHKWPHEAVYVDHDGDWPATKEFVKTIPNLTIVKPNQEGFDKVYDYLLYKKQVPSMKLRVCTAYFKIKPMLQYFKKPCIVYLGITFDESKRMKNNPHSEVFNHYPLVSLKATREQCIEYIKLKTGNVPMKSGCFFCPFQNSSQWKLLRKNHPDLYEKAKELERVNIQDQKKKGKKPKSLSLRGMILEDLTQEKQIELFT